MRAIVMLLLLSLSVPCYAEDPLETLNTVEDAISTMEQALRTRAEGRGPRYYSAGAPLSMALPSDDRLYFVSEENLGSGGWVTVKPCTEEVARAQASSGDQSCAWQPDGTVAMGAYFWKSRPASPEDLHVGEVVAVQDGSDGAWVVTRITDLSELGSGHVAVSAPFKASLRGLRVVE